MTSRRAFFLVVQIAISIFAFSLAVAFSRPHPAVSQRQSESDVITGTLPFTGYDFVVLIDQSQSMRDRETNGKFYRGSDPDYIRLEAINQIVDFLRFNTEFSKLEVKPVHRVGLVEFAYSSTVSLPLTPVTGSDGEGILQLVRSVRNGRENYGGLKTIKFFEVNDQNGSTNFEAAFDAAAQTFATSNNPSLNQRRVVVLVTDGGPEIGDLQPIRDNESEYFRRAFDRISTKYRQLFSNADDKLVVIGIDIGEQPIYWNLVSQYWLALTGPGGSVVSKDPKEVNAKMALAVCQVLKTACNFSELGQHFVKPYSKQVQFSFYKYQAGATIKLRDPVSEFPRRTDSGRKLIFRPFDQEAEVYSVSNPQPGCWESTKQGEGKVEVLMQTIFNDLVDREVFRYTVLPFPIRLELRGSGEGVRELADFPISFRGVLTDPSNKSRPISLVRIGDSYQLNAPFEAALSGRYFLEVFGEIKPDLEKYRCAQGLPADELRVFEGRFELPVQVPVIAPLNSMSKPILNYRAIPKDQIGFEFQNSETRETVVFPDNYPYRITAQLVDPSGSVRSLSVARSGGRFTAADDLVLPATGKYQVRVNVTGVTGTELFTGTVGFDIVNDVSMVAPNPAMPQGDTLNLVQIRLSPSGMALLPEPGLYRLAVTLVEPNDGKTVLDLATADSKSGLFEATAKVLLTDTRPYALEVGIFTRLSPAAAEALVSSSRFVFTPTADLAYLDLIQPKPGNSLPLTMRPLGGWAPTFLPIEPLKLDVQLLTNGKPADGKRFFSSSLTDLITATLFDKQGVVVTDAIHLTSIGKPEDGLFEAELPGIREGAYSLRYRVAGTSRVQYPEANRNRIVQFERRDPPLAAVVWAIVYASCGAALAAVFGLWAANRFFLPKAGGALVVQFAGSERSPEPETIRLGPRSRNHFVIRDKRLAKFGLRAISVKHLRSAGKGGRAQSPAAIAIESYDIDKNKISQLTGSMEMTRSPKESLVKSGGGANKSSRVQIKYVE